MRIFQSTIICCLALQACGQQSNISDSQIETSDPSIYQRDTEYEDIIEQSYYVEMDDGVKLAVNIYLPKGLKEGEKVPAITFSTRYWRAIGFKWPFNKFMQMVPHTSNFNPLEFVKYGYALVSIDVRGCGASHGMKTLTLPDIREVMDSKQTVEWIVNQPWSDGIVGATGVSYIGTTALYQLIDPHPALKAIVPSYSVFDLYDDISAPGGIYFHQFIQSYGDFCATLDRNELPPWRKSFKTQLATYGVQKVDGTSKKEFKAAIAEHDCNVYQMTEGATAEFMDDVSTLNGHLATKDILSPHHYKEVMKKSQIPIYHWSGWWDAGFQHAAFRQFMNLDNGQNVVRIGPWNHGAGANVSPTVAAKSDYNEVTEILRFFDFHLKGMKNDMYDSPRIKYYTMGEDIWKASETWPPENASDVSLFLSENGAASWDENDETSGFISYDVDTTHTVGEFDCRWNFNASHSGVTYSDRKSQDSISITFTTPELSEDIEVTGHPQLEVYLKNSLPDGAVFAYLEDVDENGNAWNVTDGQIRMIHRKLVDDAVNYIDCVPYHGYRSTDAQPMDTSKAELISFDLLPTSHLFKAGHKIQVRLAGADLDNFKNLYHEDASWQVFHGGETSSRIVLPVAERLSN
ncbi:MAG: putative CocE/NonD family hydrolase [Bacteroidia bacterium]|jgi:putative CocE/NonD family hydrolase